MANGAETGIRGLRYWWSQWVTKYLHSGVTYKGWREINGFSHPVHPGCGGSLNRKGGRRLRTSYFLNFS